MIKGLVLMKAEPLHKGHESLIEYAKKECDILYVLLCMNDEKETIPGPIRLKWLLETYKNDDKITIRYTDKKLPYTSKSDRKISKVWAEHIKKLFPDLNVFITSEPYGEYVVEYLGVQMGVKHINYDLTRTHVPISGTEIRNNPIKHWEFISDSAKPYFVKKICICGTESTGKTILTEKLARLFDTNYVPEWGRQIVRKSEEVTLEDITRIGTTHARDILEKVNSSNKILFSDTDLNTTKMYSKYFFDKIPEYEEWVENANNFDLHIFLENDAPYIQDGTRLPKEDRDKLRNYHYDYLTSKGLKIEIVNGTEWDERTQKAIDIVKKNFFNK
jgi:HTH-type transcriptional regulator, transcriptional repressor of NAD biosynthesis genes